MSNPNPKSKITTKVTRINGSSTSEADDFLAIEEPLEIQLAWQEDGQTKQKSISITMRTPGHDVDLAIGFLFTEGIIQSTAQIEKAGHVPSWNSATAGHRILLTLNDATHLDLKKLERHFYTSSSCGVCGKSSIDAVYASGVKNLKQGLPVFQQNLIYDLPNKLRAQQTIFEDTGGLHAAALFDANGQLLLLREDVGRHNAVDKLIGAALQSNPEILTSSLILVSGRASFELIQKSLMAGIPLLAAVGAPSSLAIQMASEANMTVMGFVKNGRYNIYCHPERIALEHVQNFTS